MRWRKPFYLAAGWTAVALGAVGAFLPLLPTVPFLILAAFCFARSSPALERRLIEHKTFGPHIAAWREEGAISRTGKRAATIAFAISITIGLLTLRYPYWLGPVAAAVIGGGFVLTRPTRAERG